MIVDFYEDWFDPIESTYTRALEAMGEPLASLWVENWMTLIWVKSSAPPPNPWWERMDSSSDMTAHGKATPAEVKVVISDFSRLYRTDP